MKIANIDQYNDWLIIPIKTDSKLVTYTFVLVSFDDELFHIDDAQYQSVADAVNVGKRFIDLEEARISAQPRP